VAAQIEDALDQQVRLEPGGRGEFTVWVGEHKVAGKDAAGFPSEGEVVARVNTALHG
jgi:hypothetical protein